MSGYKEAIKNAKHHKALGDKVIMLTRDEGDKPWHLVTSCEPGGSHRLDISTSVWFKAHDPKSGLSFQWSFDIEPYSANGTSSYQIDTAACRKVLEQLAPKQAKAFRAYLAECADKVGKCGADYYKIYQRQQQDATTLRQLSQDLTK